MDKEKEEALNTLIYFHKERTLDRIHNIDERLEFFPELKEAYRDYIKAKKLVDYEMNKLME